MIRHRAFALGSVSVAVATVLLVACSDGGGARASFVENDGATDVTEASLPPPSSDGGVTEASADATPPKPQYDASDEPVVCASTPCVTQLAGGKDYFCALLVDGSARCWGTDHYGELGRGQRGPNDLYTGVPPSPVAGVTNATQISASPLGMTTCVRNAARRVQCWGVNWTGQLGLQVSPPSADGMPHPTPTEVALTTDIDRVDVGPDTVCAFDGNREVYCWGSNQYGLLARPDEPVTQYEWGLGGPGLADFESHEVKRVAIGSESAFGLTSNAQILGWGVVAGRDSSLPSSAPNPGPAPLPTVRDATAVATSDRFSCAIAGGEVYCWGRNANGQLGTGFPNDERLPARARILANGGAYPQQLALGRTTACVRLTDGTIQCAGGNGHGVLARPDAGQASGDYEPVPLPGRAVQIVASEKAFCALIQGGSVVCWGSNSYGELGQGSVDYDAHPIPVAVVLE